MVRARLRLAKLTRPDSSGRVPRERLFETLDRAMATRFAWVSGPAGAGKTSLVASWLEQRKPTVVWYQIDDGDRDPATFFHFLGNAAYATARRRRSLPHLTPEYLAGLADFTRRYFRQFFAMLEAPCVVVFDACHESGSDSPCLQIIARALNEVPQGVAVVCISRNDPGEPFARWVADANYVQIGASDLRLTECEARQIARTSGQDTEAVVELLDKVNGWTAGFILMLRADRERAACEGRPGDAQQAIFEYFADEVLMGADEPTRDFLLRTSILPVVLVSIAAELTGNARAVDMLANLERNHFFTELRSRTDDDASYEYHPLFRGFLRARAAATMKAGEVAMLRRRAAELLEQRGRIEAAAALRIEAADWPELIRLIVEQAPAMMSQGRWQTLEAWIGAVPRALAESHAWLLYWRGACNCMGNPDAARLHFEAAHRNFVVAGDATGRLLACAGVLQASYFQLSEQAPALPWIGELDRTSRQLEALPVAVEARVIDGLPGAWMAQPQHPMVRRWAHRMDERLRSLPGVQRDAALLVFVSSWYLSVGDHARTRAVLAQFKLDGELIEHAPLCALAACLVLCAVSSRDGEHEEALDAVGLARSIAERSGVHVFDSAIALQATDVALSAGDVARAELELARLKALLGAQRKLELCQYHFLRSGVLLLGGQAAAALELAERELPFAEGLAAPFLTATWRIQYAQLLALGARHEDSRQQLGRALDFAMVMPSPILQFRSQLTLAWSWFLEGEESRGREALRKGLTIGRERNYLNCHPLWIPEMMVDLFARALHAGIEVDYVRRFILERDLSPGNRYPEHWPWLVQVHTLGYFEVRRREEPLQTEGKAKQRVLELLKVMVAFGPHGAALDTIAQMLWPQAEGDAANDALRVALHRLRKLLGTDRAVIVAEGKVSLNDKCCWVDAWAMERLLSADSDYTVEAIPAILRLYKGPFLQGDADNAWLLPQRERLHSKFLRLVDAGGSRRLASGDLDGAIELYRRGTELDPLAESLYRGLIECYVRQGRHAEALEVYRHCRQMLSVVLGVRPSAETEALHVLLLAAN